MHRCRPHWVLRVEASPRAKGSIMTEYRVPGLEGENDQITFEADDCAAEAISLAWLIELGRDRAEGGAWGPLASAEDGVPEVPEPVTDVGVHHRWAWDFARKCLTNYDAVAERLLQSQLAHSCERCLLIEDEITRSKGPSVRRRTPVCEDCLRSVFSSIKTVMRRLDLLREAVVTWAGAHWPELEVRSVAPGAMDDDFDEAQEMAITTLRAQRGGLQ